jgi:PDZ domain-containing protein
MSFFGYDVEDESHAADGWEEPKRRGFGWRSVVGILVTAIFLGGSYFAFQAPTPYVIEQPGTVFNVLGKQDAGDIISISGAKTYPTSGDLFLLTVGLVGQPGATPSWVEVFRAWNDPKKVVLPIDSIYPPGVKADTNATEQIAMMNDSQQQATASALRELGYKVASKVNVIAVNKDSPAAGILKANDIVTAVNGKPLENGSTLRALVKKNADSKPMKLEVLRAAHKLNLEATPVLIDKTWRLGIIITDTYDFPVDVKLKLQSVGGPSGGMMFALGIIDELTPGYLNGGQSVAGTGEIDGNGVVYPIGGIRQKMFGAVDAGATWFLAPEANCDEVVGHIPDVLKVTKVANLNDAVMALNAIAANPETKSLPQCSAKN